MNKKDYLFILFLWFPLFYYIFSNTVLTTCQCFLSFSIFYINLSTSFLPSWTSQRVVFGKHKLIEKCFFRYEKNIPTQFSEYIRSHFPFCPLPVMCHIMTHNLKGIIGGDVVAVGARAH